MSRREDSMGNYPESYHRVFDRALLEGEFTIPAGSPKQASALRWELYRFRRAAVLEVMEFARYGRVEMRVDGPNLVMRVKEHSALAQIALNALGQEYPGAEGESEARILADLKQEKQP